MDLLTRAFRYSPFTAAGGDVFSGKYTLDEVKVICGRGGVVAYLGTNDFYEVELKMADNPRFKFIADAFLYNGQRGRSNGCRPQRQSRCNPDYRRRRKRQGMMKDLTEYISFIAP